MKAIVNNHIDITDGEHFDPKGVYTVHFDGIPNINNIYEVDGDVIGLPPTRKMSGPRAILPQIKPSTAR